jgi:hypothetical protein
MIRALHCLWFTGVAALMSVGTATALEVQVGHLMLLPNQAGQVVEITVSGGEMVSGVNLYAQVGDGGPELASVGLPAGKDGPAITSVDLKTAGVFAAVPDPAVNLGSLPQVAVWSLGIAAQGGKVPAQGRLGTLTVDTTGFEAGRWDLKLSDVLSGLDGGPFATDFAGLAATISNGSLRINGGRSGDTDGDGDVDLVDLNNVRNHFGAAGGNPIGDTLPFNGSVELEDLNAVRNNFGQSGGAAAVPEPAGSYLAATAFFLGGAALCRRRSAAYKKQGRRLPRDAERWHDRESMPHLRAGSRPSSFATAG